MQKEKQVKKVAKIKPAPLVESNNLPMVNPETLLMQAIKNGNDIQTIEKLMLMRKELKSEWSREQFFKCLSGFQKECPSINKNKKVDFTSKREGASRTKYNYADLEEIVSHVKLLLEKYGFSYTIKTAQTKDEVTAICYANHADGHTESTSFSIPIDYESYMNTAQRVASALTYAKRYAFSNAFGIMTADEDDDGSSDNDDDAGKNKKKKPANDKQNQDTQVKTAQVKRIKTIESNMIKNFPDKFNDEWFKDVKFQGTKQYSCTEMSVTERANYITFLETTDKEETELRKEPE